MKFGRGWNRGTHIQTNTGRTHWTKESVRDLEFIKKQRASVVSGNKHGNWKGDQASYVAKHEWMVLHFGKPEFCEACGTEEAKRFEWANISGQYLRDREDWLRLCTSCHRKYDNNMTKAWITRRMKKDKII